MLSLIDMYMSKVLFLSLMIMFTTFNNEGSKLPIYPDTLPERIVVRSSGPAGDSHPTAMGLYKKLPGLPPVWEHFLFPDHKLFFDGENEI